MKKILRKETLIAFIIGILIASGITVYAATYLAKDITYKDGKTVEQALDDLYGKNLVTPMNIELKGVVMGSNVERATYDAIELDNLNKYKKLTIRCTESIGTYIDAKIYIDEALVLTISDTLEHELTLNNNSELKITCESKNNLMLGSISFYVTAE